MSISWFIHSLLLCYVVIDNPLLRSDSESVSSAKEFPPPCSHIQFHQAKLLNSLPFSRLAGDSYHSWRLYAVLLAPRGVLVCVRLFEVPNDLLHIAVHVSQLHYIHWFIKPKFLLLFFRTNRSPSHPLLPLRQRQQKPAQGEENSGYYIF